MSKFEIEANEELKSLYGEVSVVGIMKNKMGLRTCTAMEKGIQVGSII